VYPAEHAAHQRDARHALNRHILEHAAWLAAAHFAELHVVYTWEAYGEHELRSGRSPYHWDADAYVERERKRNAQALDMLLGEVHESMESEGPATFNPVTHLVKGNRRDEIVRLARGLEADLVVLGTMARSGITGLIVESTSEAITKSVDCSVLVVKSPGFVTPVVVEE
jgi:nucleotide-binding universal stress UspA family protein